MAKKEKDLHGVFLDLANAFGSVPHKLLWADFDFICVSEQITKLIKVYFLDLQICITVEVSTTTWQQAGGGIPFNIGM